MRVNSHASITEAMASERSEARREHDRYFHACAVVYGLRHGRHSFQPLLSMDSFITPPLIIITYSILRYFGRLPPRLGRTSRCWPASIGREADWLPHFHVIILPSSAWDILV